MVTKHIAVVAGHDDQRVVVAAALLEAGDQPADVVVDLGDHAVIGRAQASLIGLVHVADPARAVDPRRQERMLRGLFLGRGRATERRAAGGVVHAVVRLGRDVRAGAA